MESLGKIKQRHKMEERFLMTRIKQIRKNKTLSKEAIAAQIANLEEELHNKHLTEIKEAEARHESDRNDPTVSENVAVSNNSTSSSISSAVLTNNNQHHENVEDLSTAQSTTKDDTDQTGTKNHMSRAQKRREKKKQANAALRAAAAAQPTGPNKRICELAALTFELNQRGLMIRKIASDGNCMFRALADQIMVVHETLKTKLLNLAQHSKYSNIYKSGRTTSGDLLLHTAIRFAAADHMIHHQDEFAPFIDTTEFDSFEHYVDQMADPSGKQWGGQIELMALTKVFGCPIEVWQADSSAINTIANVFNEKDTEEMPQLLSLARRASISNAATSTLMGENNTGPTLHISFHRHYYALGDHYNSVVLIDQ